MIPIFRLQASRVWPGLWSCCHLSGSLSPLSPFCLWRPFWLCCAHLDSAGESPHLEVNRLSTLILSTTLIRLCHITLCIHRTWGQDWGYLWEHFYTKWRVHRAIARSRPGQGLDFRQPHPLNGVLLAIGDHSWSTSLGCLPRRAVWINFWGSQCSLSFRWHKFFILSHHLAPDFISDENFNVGKHGLRYAL